MKRSIVLCACLCTLLMPVHAHAGQVDRDELLDHLEYVTDFTPREIQDALDAARAREREESIERFGRSLKQGIEALKETGDYPPREDRAR